MVLADGAPALAYRLRALGLLSEWRHTQTVKKPAQLGYRTGEPGSLLARENSQLLAKVFDALHTRRMTPSAAPHPVRSIRSEDASSNVIFGNSLQPARSFL
ncbi:hypothetical protein ACIOKD_37670 [Streptomyces sp. NPDC087844]|uniref:hypothetical protein n=1 Tax=Streptomyces sp. NPDC087844 TaxID=3365805 RepID=UPI0038062143